MNKNIFCKLMGHDYPETRGMPVNLLDDFWWYRCKRCNHSGFGDNPFDVFGGVTKFINDNHTWFEKNKDKIVEIYKRKFYE